MLALIYVALAKIAALQGLVNDLYVRVGKLIANGGGGGSSGGGLSFSTGTGEPEGVVTGSPGDTYWDTSTDFYYVKVTGTATNTGWMVH